MQKITKYAIFETKWGYFGFVGTQSALLRICLPLPSPRQVKSHLLKVAPLAARQSSSEHQVSSFECDKTLFKSIQEQIVAYFEGACIDFSPNIPVVLDGLSLFARSVLTACRDIEFGQTLTYSQLAKKSGRPDAARAVGGALAKNPLPLIIPCHRVVRSDGKLGGFSAPGAVPFKAKLLQHEQVAPNDPKSH